MRPDQRRTILAMATFGILLALDSFTIAAPISRCDAAKKKCIGKYVAAVLRCHAKAESTGTAVDPTCLAKAAAKITGAGKGCFDKNDAKVPNDCFAVGDGPQRIADADAFVLDVVDDVDPGYPTPTLSRCGAARKKCIGKKAAGLMGCAAKTNKDGIGDPVCATRVADKFGGASGCDVKALAHGTDCVGSATTASVEAKVDTWHAATVLAIDVVNPNCGNGVIDPGEFCDPEDPAASGDMCGPDVTCNPFTCNCECPGFVQLLSNGLDPQRFDIGWTGLGHDMPMVGGIDLTLGVTCAASERPCGTCALAGPIANSDGLELRNQRCTNDTSIECSSDEPCTAGGGTCEFFFGPSLPVVTAGVATCMTSQIDGAVAGTTEFETGETAMTLHVLSRVYTGLAVDAPCPRCVGDINAQDGLREGTCDAGARMGSSCDANGTVSGRPDFGATSLDCPPNAGALIATLPVDLSSATDPVTKTLSMASPPCSGEIGERCLCDTCNNAAAEPCTADGECPDPAGPTGPICGGKRCLGGPNAGTPCTSSSECPTGFCGRPGEPTRPSACIDDTTTVGVLDCDDPGSGHGECTMGPLTQSCSVGSGHAQRGCATDADCGGGAGSCESSNRKCFLTGGLTGKNGTNTLVADGVEQTPAHGVSHPTLGGVSCIGATASAAVNTTMGLPGPQTFALTGPLVTKRYRPCPSTGNDVGVIPEKPGNCPGNYVAFLTDDENTNNHSGITAWHGAVRNVPMAGPPPRDTQFGFCRVPGDLFHEVAAEKYSVLRLGSCLVPSRPARHTFHTEDSGFFSSNEQIGDITPSKISNEWTTISHGLFPLPIQHGTSSVSMEICVYETTGGTSTVFPNLQYPYGVFATYDPAWLASGVILTDDQASLVNPSGDDPYAHSEMMITPLDPASGGLDSQLHVAKVRNDPCTNPCPYAGIPLMNNCYIDSAPTGATAFIRQDSSGPPEHAPYTDGASLYYTMVNGECPYLPYPESHVDFPNCFVTTLPRCTYAFVDPTQTRWFVLPICRP